MLSCDSQFIAPAYALSMYAMCNMSLLMLKMKCIVPVQDLSDVRALSPVLRQKLKLNQFWFSVQAMQHVP